MTDTVIDEMAVIDRAIIDKNVHIGGRAQVGVGQDLDTPNRADPRLNTGLTLIGKNAVISGGTIIGRNCVIASDTSTAGHAGRIIASGETIDGTEMATGEPR
jgi:glucose-1-phosphate adenylyltransferase